MKIDPFQWTEIDGVTFSHGKGRLRLICSEKSCVYIEAEGFEILADVGHKIDLTFEGTVRVRVEGPEGNRVFLYDPMSIAREPTGEVFTNADRQPMESGNLYEVRKEMRMFALERKAMLDEMRQHRRNMDRTDPFGKPDPDPNPFEKPTEKPTENPETPEGDDGE